MNTTRQFYCVKEHRIKTCMFLLVSAVLLVCSCGKTTNKTSGAGSSALEVTAAAPNGIEIDTIKEADTGQKDEDIDLTAQYANNEGIPDAIELINKITNNLSADDIIGVDHIDFEFLPKAIKVSLYDATHCIKTGYWDYGDETYHVNQWYEELNSSYREEIHDENGRVKIRRCGLDTFYYTYSNEGRIIEIEGIESQISPDYLLEEFMENLPTKGGVIEEIIYDDEFREEFPLACLGLATLVEDDDIVLQSEVEKAVKTKIGTLAEDLEFQYTWTQLEYDENNNLVKELWSSKEDKTPEWIYLYNYSKEGLPTEEYWEWTEDEFKKTIHFEYDAQSRLEHEICETEAGITSRTIYFYDETGEIVARLEEDQNEEYNNRSLTIKKAFNRQIKNDDLYTKSNNGYNKIFLSVFKEGW